MRLTSATEFTMKFFDVDSGVVRQKSGMTAAKIARYIDGSFGEIDDIQIFYRYTANGDDALINVTSDALELCAVHWEKLKLYHKVIEPFIYSLTLPDEVMARIRDKQAAAEEEDAEEQAQWSSHIKRERAYYRGMAI